MLRPAFHSYAFTIVRARKSKRRSSHSRSLRREKSSVSLLTTHYVFAPKYRRRAITQRVFDIFERELRRVCAAIGVEIREARAEGDHVHLLLAKPPKLSDSMIMHRIKGATSRRIRASKYPETFVHSKRFWSPSFYAGSCGGAPLGTVAKYIRSQGALAPLPLAGGKTIPPGPKSNGKPSPVAPLRAKEPNLPNPMTPPRGQESHATAPRDSARTSPNA